MSTLQTIHQTHKNKLAESGHQEASTRPSIPGILRLPCELRLKIYDYLFDEFYGSDSSNTFQSSGLSPKLFQVPITHVCRTIRYETFSIVYRGLPWAGHFHSLTKTSLRRNIALLAILDPYALEFMGEARFLWLKHSCPQKVSKETNLAIKFMDGRVSFRIQEEEEVCCKVKAYCDGVLKNLAQQFVDHVNQDSNTMKEELLQLIEAVYRCEFGPEGMEGMKEMIEMSVKEAKQKEKGANRGAFGGRW